MRASQDRKGRVHRAPAARPRLRSWATAGCGLAQQAAGTSLPRSDGAEAAAPADGERGGPRAFRTGKHRMAAPDTQQEAL